jgi:hypothetical protein
VRGGASPSGVDFLSRQKEHGLRVELFKVANRRREFPRYALLPPTVDFESLRRYSSTKLSIANQLRSLLDLLKKRGDESRVQSCEQLMAKLAEDRFTVAVLGQFKRGKSSLLNAIIGRNLLPTAILPLTTVITVVRFGTRERLVIQREGLQFPEHQLAKYIFEEASQQLASYMSLRAPPLPSGWILFCKISVCTLQRRAGAGVVRRKRRILPIPYLAIGSNLLTGRSLGRLCKID